ncbi:hypothetical protein [Actinomadura viridis]|uniref:Uncharacterized protein n=1 Tax=Actinomadura viridis TaxID=58110 RepID=A0A931DHW9_9ACTN|nr:hypothetical protein [Actinomadura viridis]MBG6089632.1 hypothetical protein [Actinomadura viridis]
MRPQKRPGRVWHGEDYVENNHSLRDIASRLVITTGKERGRHPSPATMMRLPCEHDDQQAAATG